MFQFDTVDTPNQLCLDSIGSLCVILPRGRPMPCTAPQTPFPLVLAKWVDPINPFFFHNRGPAVPSASVKCTPCECSATTAAVGSHGSPPPSSSSSSFALLLVLRLCPGIHSEWGENIRNPFPSRPPQSLPRVLPRECTSE